MLERKTPPCCAWIVVTVAMACRGWQCGNTVADAGAAQVDRTVTFTEVTTTAEEKGAAHLARADSLELLRALIDLRQLMRADSMQ